MNVNVFYKSPLLLFGAMILCAACSEEKPAGSIEVQIIQPAGPHCAYKIAAAQVQTLESLTTMSGRIGRVVTSRENLEARPEILDTGAGLVPVDIQFSSSGNLFSPLDYNSLFAISLYYAIERGYLLFAGLDPQADMAKVVPDLYNTSIVHEARRTFGDVGTREEVQDNAEYLPHVPTTGRQRSVRNYIFSFPTDAVVDIPLGLNLGIMVHEYTHLVFNYLFHERALASGTTAAGELPSDRTIAALEEGLADYFGFMATQDPGFFDCSYPESGRDLSKPKTFTDPIIAGLEGGQDFDSHEGGAVFASINYEIGQAIGFDVNAKSLIRLMSGLQGCAGARSGSASLNLNFASVASCHAGVSDPAAQATVQQIYAKYLGSYGGTR